ncbi:MAG: hypothetical protein JSV27_01670 [Candidatus Bathyarchaeota archaeon]|nr:MAG: hypothetical protein JSV27_01670 [Candidatus Bathyarchaeota archaeon]
MSALQKLVDQFTPKKLAVFYTILTIAYMLFPVTMPMKVSSWTYDYVAQIDKLEPGDVVVWGHNMATIARARAGLTKTTAIMQYLMERQLKIIMISFGPASPSNFYKFMTDYAKSEDYGYVYGVDWVVTPFLAGEESVIAMVGDDMWYPGTDMFGTPISEIPIYENIHVISDAQLTMCDGGGFSWQPMYVRQWAIRHEMPMVNNYGFQQIAIYYGIYVQGVLDRTRGVAEFMYLTGFQGESILRFQFRNIGAALVFITVILGNLAHYSKRKEEREMTGVRA